MADDTDAAGIHVGPGRQEFISDLEVPGGPVVPEFIALDLYVGFFRPPVKDERHGDHVAVFGVAFGGLQRHLVVLDAGMSDRKVLRQYDPRMRAAPFGFEHKNVHRAVLNGHGMNAVHGVSSRFARYL